MSHADAGMPHPRRGLLGARGGLLTEVLIVLGLSLGASAIWSVLRIVERLTRAAPRANTGVRSTKVPQ